MFLASFGGCLFVVWLVSGWCDQEGRTILHGVIMDLTVGFPGFRTPPATPLIRSGEAPICPSIEVTPDLKQ